MLLPAEIESKTLIPALRAIIAKNLATRHKMREDEISKMLNLEFHRLHQQLHTWYARLHRADCKNEKDAVCKGLCRLLIDDAEFLTPKRTHT